MSVENLNPDEKKESSKDNKEGNKISKPEYKHSEKITEIRKKEQEEKIKEGNPDDILNNFPTNIEKGNDILGNLSFYESTETTPTGKRNEWTKNMQGLSKEDVVRICVQNNLNTSSNKAFQADIYDKLLASPAGQKILVKMWSEYGNTNQGAGSNLQQIIDQIQSTEKVGKQVPGELLQQLRAAFVDGNLGARTVYLLKLIDNNKIPPASLDIKSNINTSSTDIMKSMFSYIKVDENKFVNSYNGLSNVSIGDVTYMRGPKADKMGYPDAVILLDTRGKTENEKKDAVMMKVIAEYGLEPGAKYMLLYKTQNETTTTNNFTETIRKAIATKSIMKVPTSMSPEEVQNMLVSATAKL